MAMLVAEGPVTVFPTPAVHRGHCTGEPTFAALLKAFLHTRRATAAHSPVWLGLHWAGCTTAPNEHAEPEWGVCASENSPTPKRKLLLLGFRVGLVFIGIHSEIFICLLTKIK